MRKKSIGFSLKSIQEAIGDDIFIYEKDIAPDFRYKIYVRRKPGKDFHRKRCPNKAGYKLKK
jgi:hypothetical protein